MGNPFKVGDTVVPKEEGYFKNWPLRGSRKVEEVLGYHVLLDDGGLWAHENFRVPLPSEHFFALGQAKPRKPAAPFQAYAGHLPDGSSVQRHSAGGLYPCVLIYRDSRLCGGKYDVGVISPRNPEPIWLSTLDAAVLVADAIKKDLA